MNHLYGTIQNSLRTSQQAIQGQMERSRELAKRIDSDDPLEVKRIEEELKDISTTLTYFKGIEDLLVKMATLPS